jgi:hypothetical protein
MIVKAIVLSDAYQREASAPKSMTAKSSNGILHLSSELDVDLFARARVRAMTGEQLFDSVRTAMGLELLLEDLDSAADLRTRSEFAATFQIGRPATAERSILQSLALMNGELASRLALPDSIPLVVAVADAP